MRLRAFVNKKKLEKLKTYPSLSSTFWILLGADHTVVTMEHRLKNLSFHFIPRYFVLLFSTDYFTSTVAFIPSKSRPSPDHTFNFRFAST